MPNRAPSPCTTPGCGYLTTSGGKCDAHKRDMERKRGSSSERGYGAEHRARRRQVLARDPLCVNCLATGRVRVSTVYDHIVPIESGGSVDDMDNAQGLCDGKRGRGCHDFKRSAERRGRQLQVRQGTGFTDIGQLGQVKAYRMEYVEAAA